MYPQAKQLPSLKPFPLPMEGGHGFRAAGGLDFGHSPDPGVPGTLLMAGQLNPQNVFTSGTEQG